MSIRLYTFGGLRLARDDGPLDSLLKRRSRAALFVYLAVEREASRESLAKVFWPDSETANARHALRQSLYHLRGALGPTAIDARAHVVRVSADVRTDTGAFAAALESGNTEAAARLYAGPFLHGINLIDLKPWENWVDARRAQYAREFRRVCRELVDAKRAAGDMAGAIEVARIWVAPDPLDDEPQHRLIEVLAAAGERTEAIREYETYARLLEADGLRPLDDTVALAQRVRASAVPWPEPDRAEPPRAAGPPPPAALPPPTASPAAHVRPQAMATMSGRRPGRVLRRPAQRLAAIGGLCVLVGAFMLADSRTPDRLLASLSADAVARGERIVLADFTGPATNPVLGAVITDALRIDLLQSPVVHPLDGSEVRHALQRMQVPADSRLTPELARQVALRDGAKAVLEGDVGSAGTGYVLTAALRSTTTDRVLAAFRETAAGPDDVIPAIDRLSRRIRRHAGESLRSIAAAPPLAQVTTRSLEALRIYVEAGRAFEQYDHLRVVQLVEEALAVDTEFAMAWRLLATTLANTGWDRVRQVEAATRAFELSDRLDPRERHLTEAGYHSHVTGDHHATVEAYRRVLELHPDDRVALNNLGVIYFNAGRFSDATPLFEKAVDRNDPPARSLHSLVFAYIAGGRLDDARATARMLADRYPDDPSTLEATFWVHLYDGAVDAAAAVLDAVLADPSVSARQRAWTHDRMARLALWRGRLDDAREHLEAAERAALHAGPPLNAFAWRLRRAHIETAVGDPDRGVRLLREGIEDRLLDDVPPPDRQHAFQATILGMAGRVDEMEAVLRRLDADVPPELRSVNQHHNESARAFVHLHRADPEEAIVALRLVRVSHPCRYCFALSMGWAQQARGRLEEAAEEWEAALAGKDVFEEPGVQLANRLWIMQRLPSVYEALGDSANAVRHYQHLVALWEDADPELRPRVEHARHRIAALTPRGGGPTRTLAGALRYLSVQWNPTEKPELR
jgi:eukaryotic-like serine/threonine-protein kinase